MIKTTQIIISDLRGFCFLYQLSASFRYFITGTFQTLNNQGKVSERMWKKLRDTSDDRQVLKCSQHSRSVCVDKCKLHFSEQIVCEFQRDKLIDTDCTDYPEDDTKRPYQRFVFQLHSRRHLRNMHTEMNAHQHKSPIGAEHMHCSGEHRTADIHKGKNVL